MHRIVRAALPVAIFAFAVFGIAPIGRGADQPIDLSKLKKGDKLEVLVGQEWVAAEFVEKVSNNMIRVKRDDFPQPVGALVRMTRLPAKPLKGEKKGAPRDANDPFATPEEKEIADALRTWSDTSGKFKVQARLIRIEGEQVVLLRDDDKEIVVPIEKFTDADKQYIADVRSGKVNLAVESDTKEENVEPTEAASVKITPTNVSRAVTISISGVEPWLYQPEPRAENYALEATRVAFYDKGDFFDQAQRILLMPHERKALVVVVNTRPGQAQACRFELCDLASGTVQAGTLAPEVAPLDISPDGNTVLARTEGFGFGKKNELRIYERSENGVKLQVAWLPYGDGGSDAANPGATTKKGHGGGGNADPRDDVEWAAFVDPTHVLTLSHDRDLVLWEIPQLKAVYTVKCSMATTPALSANRKYAAVPTSDGVALLQTLDGKVVGVLPRKGASLSALAFRDDGKRLAMRQGQRLSVWDLESQKLIRDFPVQPAGGSTGPISWADDEHILSGTTLVDIERRVPIWTFNDIGSDWTVRDGVIWSVSKASGRSNPGLTGVIAVPQAALDVVRGLNADELLAIKPGIEVAVELPGAGTADGDNVRAAILQQLEEAGIKVVPQSNIRLVGTIQTGKTVQIQYHAFGSRAALPFSATEQILTFTWFVDNQPIWQHERHTNPPTILRLQEGQTVDQAIQKAMQIEVSAFGALWVPVYVPRPNPNLKHLNAAN